MKRKHQQVPPGLRPRRRQRDVDGPRRGLPLDLSVALVRADRYLNRWVPPMGHQERNNKRHKHSIGRETSNETGDKLKEQSLNAEDSRPCRQALGVDLIQIDHTMRVVAQRWRGMAGHAMHR